MPYPSTAADGPPDSQPLPDRRYRFAGWAANVPIRLKGIEAPIQFQLLLIGHRQCRLFGGNAVPQVLYQAYPFTDRLFT